MKKIILILALIMISTNAMAKWTLVDESEDDGGYTVYVDLSSKRKADDRAKMWSLFDYKVEQKASGVNFLSKTVRRDYDCSGRHIRILAFKLFSWNMEQGRLVRSYSQPQKWELVQPGSMDETEWKVACEQ